MTIHAKVDILDVIRGWWFDHGTPENKLIACGADHMAIPSRSQRWAATRDSDGWTDTSNDVTCPECLALIRAAIDPVRWDHAETLGLAPKLEAK